MENEEYSGTVYDVSSEDEFSTDSFDDSECLESDQELQKAGEMGAATLEAQPDPVNLLQKLLNRETVGCFSGYSRRRHVPQRAFSKVPNRLVFCLKDIVPHCFLQGHMFMGLSACGQFLLSYKVSCNDSIRISHYSMNIGYSYTLYFWIYQPHKPLRSFYKCCLFDDHGVDNLKQVTVTQWKRCVDARVLIVHGAAEDENEDSYITYVKVPKLGCLDCKKLRDSEGDGYFRWYPLCLKCNLTIHTKYSSTESDRKFDPYTNLICPERILIIANGFMHMLHIDMEQPAPLLSQQHISQQSSPSGGSFSPRDNLANAERRPPPIVEENVMGCDNHNNIVARIIADFSDIETDSTHSSVGSRHGEPAMSYNDIIEAGSGVGIMTGNCVSRKTYEELIFTCNGSSQSGAGPSASGSGESSIAVASSISAVSKNNAGAAAAKVNLVNHTGKRHHRIVTKSFRNGVTTVDLQGLSASAPGSSATSDKSNTYEFSEDNEKCEKIATLRKRRLAEKKYEFSEDNSENIIPFTKIRSANKSFNNTIFAASPPSSGGSHATRSLHRQTAAGTGLHLHSSPCASPSSSPHSSFASSSAGCDSRHCTPPPMHRASPIALQQCGFRSPPPCSSSVPVGVLRSPSRHLVSSAQIYNHKSPAPPPPHPPLSQATQQMLSFKPLGTLSPLQVSMAKRNHLELGGSMSPNASVPFLSPRREEFRVVELPLQDGLMPEKPMCTKKFKRRYVEEDDAASVITSEEDDCISPGYHTSLPMEVHGSCYSEMQMISQASYQQLHCASVVVTQHSFDLETFTYYVISSLCQKNNKTYDVFYDWACELIRVCPLSYTIICLLMAQFSARDQLPATPTNCLNCSRKLDCAFHRSQFECRILFTWNMETGEWKVLDYGELMECKLSDLVSPIKRCGVPALSLAQTAKKLAHEMASNLNRMQDPKVNLRVLDSNVKRSKTCLVDQDNMIEFYLKRPRRRD